MSNLVFAFLMRILKIYINLSNIFNFNGCLQIILWARKNAMQIQLRNGLVQDNGLWEP